MTALAVVDVCPPSWAKGLFCFLLSHGPAAHPSIAPASTPTIPTASRLHQDEDVDMDEVECILANLIHQRYIKGYIAHTQKILVCSPDNAFPTIKKA